MRQWTGSALVQIKACRLFGAKSLSKPMLGYFQLNHWQETSVKFNQNTDLSFTEMHMKISSAKRRPFCPEIDELYFSTGGCSCYFNVQISNTTLRSLYFFYSISHPGTITERPRWWDVRIGSGNGLVSPGNKPLPEPVLPKFYNAIWRHQVPSWVVNALRPRQNAWRHLITSLYKIDCILIQISLKVFSMGPHNSPALV